MANSGIEMPVATVCRYDEEMTKNRKRTHILAVGVTILIVAVLAQEALAYGTKRLHIHQALSECWTLSDTHQINHSELVCRVEHYDHGLFDELHIRVTEDHIAVSLNGGWKYLFGAISDPLLMLYRKPS